MTVDTYPGGGFSVRIASGTSRGSTTSSAVFTIPMAGVFSHNCNFIVGYDGLSESRNALFSGSQGTFYSFQPITTSALTARLRVWRDTTSAGGTQSTTTWATSVTAVFCKWMAVGD